MQLALRLIDSEAETIIPVQVIREEPAPIVFDEHARAILMAQVVALFSYGLDTLEITIELGKLKRWDGLRQCHVHNALGWWRQIKGRAS